MTALYETIYRTTSGDAVPHYGEPIKKLPASPRVGSPSVPAQLTEIEEAFKNLKGDLGIRPIFHQLPHRIEAHIFIAFLTYCLHVTLRRRLRDLASGLTPRAVLEKFSAMQMIDVHLPTTDGRTIILFALHPARGRSSAPAQTTQTPITRSAAAQNHGLRPTGQIGLCSEDFLGVWVDFERLTIGVPLESAKSG
jgi:hypothetical protein